MLMKTMKSQLTELSTAIEKSMPIFIFNVQNIPFLYLLFNKDGQSIKLTKN